MRELIGIAYSPYTEKARWALLHHRVPYQYSEHTILLGMPALRLKTRKFFAPLTVPVLIDGSTRFFDSWDIARYADALGERTPLFPEGKETELRELNELSETALDAARALYIQKLKGHRDAKIQSLPKPIPDALRPLLIPMVDMGISYILNAFSTNNKPLEEHEATFRKILSLFREKIRKANGGPILGKFSYADIVVAVCLQFIAPVGNQYIKLRPANRECCEQPELRKEFHDLVEWRDRIYAEHRPV